MSKKITANTVKPVVGTLYPPPYHAPCTGRIKSKLGDPFGLTQFGVNLTRLPPGAWSAQRHWHALEDEFVYVLEGEVVMVSDDGEEILRAGDAVGFKAGVADGHCLQNRSGKDAVLIEVGGRDDAESCVYPDIDMLAPPHAKPAIYTRKDGTPYSDIKRRGPEK